MRRLKLETESTALSLTWTIALPTDKMVSDGGSGFSRIEGNEAMRALKLGGALGIEMLLLFAGVFNGICEHQP